MENKYSEMEMMTAGEMSQSPYTPIAPPEGVAIEEAQAGPTLAKRVRKRLRKLRQKTLAAIAILLIIFGANTLMYLAIVTVSKPKLESVRPFDFDSRQDFEEALRRAKEEEERFSYHLHKHPLALIGIGGIDLIVMGIMLGKLSERESRKQKRKRKKNG